MESTRGKGRGTGRYSLLPCLARRPSILLGPHTHIQVPRIHAHNQNNKNRRRRTYTNTRTHIHVPTIKTTKTDDGVRCYAHIVDATDTKGRPSYCSKITSLKSYLAMNREVSLRFCVYLLCVYTYVQKCA